MILKTLSALDKIEIESVIEILNFPPEVDSFAKEVERCRKNKLSKIIENTSIEHAFVLISALLSFAATENTNVQMVSGSLMDAFYKHLVPEAKTALDKGCAISVITLCSEEELEGNAFANLLREHPAGSITPIGRRQEETKHFFVTDHAYRVEVDDVAKKAYASFNDRGGLVTNILRNQFVKLLPRGAAGEVHASSGLIGAH